MEFLIRQIENWQAKTPAEILAYFQESVSTNNERDYKASDLDTLLGPDNCEIVCSSLRVAAATYARFEAAWAALPITGIELYSDGRQDGIRLLAQVAGWPDALRDAVLALGRTTATRWERNAGPDAGELPTVEQIAETVVAMKAIDAKALVRQWRDEVLLPLVDAATNEGKTVEEIKALIVA